MSELSYQFTNSDGNFQNGWPAAPAFGVALQLEECLPMATMFLLVDEGLSVDTRLYARVSDTWVPLALLPESPYTPFGSSNGGTIAGFGNIILGARNEHAHVSNNRGSSFTDIDNPIPPENFDLAGVDRSGVLWSVSETGSDPTHSLWKSTNLGASWEEVQSDFLFTRVLAFGSPGQIGAAEVSSFAFDIFGAQVRLSEDNGLSFTVHDTDDVVSNINQTIFPTGIHYLDSGRIVLTYVFQDASGGVSSEARAVYLDGGSWSTPVAISDVTGAATSWRATNKGTEVAMSLWNGSTERYVHVSSDGVTWTELPPLPSPADSGGPIAYDTNGVLHILAEDGFAIMYSYIDGDWVANPTGFDFATDIMGIPQ